jgi:diguanylate cyclase (GGDEF)-like protein
MSTPQLLDTARHKDSNTLDLVLRPFAELGKSNNDKISAALRLNTVLQTTLDISTLIKLFADELIVLMPFDGFTYRNKAHDIEISYGKVGRHKCTYRLIVGDENLGEVLLSRRRKFQEQETTMVENLLIGLVCPLRNALTYLNAVRAAQKDPLTGINNRTAMDSALTREIELARRHRTPLSLIVMDIDKFKSINDTYGHATGDEVIKSFTAVVNKIIRKTDMLFRYGGEEFVVITSNTGTDGSLLLAERIRRAIEKMEIVKPDCKISVTASLGVASLHGKEDGKSLFDRADQALYEAKSTGRNCVCRAESIRSYA